MLLRPMIDRNLGDYQHGFRENRSIYTCVKQILDRVREDKELKIFEFDLSAFFNQIDVDITCAGIESIAPG